MYYVLEKEKPQGSDPGQFWEGGMPGWGLEGQEEITKRYEKLTGMICIFFLIILKILGKWLYTVAA